MIEIIDAATLVPAAYNPREADPARLELVHLSLRKLGWLLPVYVAGIEGGILEILSGHQRHLVAVERWGSLVVPIDRCPALTYDDRRLVNIAFNRGTNDLTASDTCRSATEDLERLTVGRMAEDFPDLHPDDPAAMPCVTAHRKAPIADFVESCLGRWNAHAARVTAVLGDRGIRMPVVVSGSRVINGVGRLQYAAEKGETAIDVVEVPADRAELAEAMLNLLTMDFVIHERYADLLRFSNNRRFRSSTTLNRGMIFALDRKATAKSFDTTDPVNRTKWRRFYGSTVLDFGSGPGRDTEILRSMGVDCDPFEPWAYGDAAPGREDLDAIDPDQSRANVRTFLGLVPTKRWDSIFLASVLNSVPFDADRRHLITLVAALAQGSRVYACSVSSTHASLKHVNGGDFRTDYHQQRAYFGLDYEPRILMTSFGKAAKTQRFFTPGEFFDLWSERFHKVKVDGKGGGSAGGLVLAWVKDPKPIPWKDLAAAIRFEFDLPFPDGSRLGLVKEARAAFKKRRKDLK